MLLNAIDDDRSSDDGAPNQGLTFPESYPKSTAVDQYVSEKDNYESIITYGKSSIKGPTYANSRSLVVQD